MTAGAPEGTRSGWFSPGRRNLTGSSTRSAAAFTVTVTLPTYAVDVVRGPIIEVAWGFQVALPTRRSDLAVAMQRHVHIPARCVTILRGHAALKKQLAGELRCAGGGDEILGPLHSCAMVPTASSLRIPARRSAEGKRNLKEDVMTQMVLPALWGVSLRCSKSHHQLEAPPSPTRLGLGLGGET